MKTCKFCKNQFAAQYPKQKFCSQYCAQQSIFKKAFFTEHPRADCEGCNQRDCSCQLWDGE